MALAFTRYRENYPAGQEGLANTVRVAGNFTTAGGVAPTIKSSGPFTVTRTGAGVLVVSLSENVAEFLYADASLWVPAANSNQAKIRSDGFSLGSNILPASFTIETQTVIGTAGDLTGPVVSFNIAYRKGSLKNR